MREYRITIRPAAGVQAGSWLWYVDQGEEQLAEGAEDDAVEAAMSAASWIGYHVTRHAHVLRR